MLACCGSESYIANDSGHVSSINADSPDNILISNVRMIEVFRGEAMLVSVLTSCLCLWIRINNDSPGHILLMYIAR